MNFGKTTSIIISGGALFYLLAQSTKYLSSRVKIDRQIKSPEDTQNSHCHICETQKVEEPKNKFVTCKKCEASVCTKTCSEFLNEIDLWECFRCKKSRIIQQRTGEWFLKQMQEFSSFSFQMALGEDILNLQNENANKVIISKVRQLIEKSLIKILNGSDDLDAIPIDKISDKDEYLPSSSYINTDYVELKRFINRICQEVVNITDTLEFTETTSVPKASFDPQTYEELLATAVLNKITSDYLHRKKKHGMSNEIVAERDSEVTEDDDFSFYDKMHLDKIQSHKISLPDLLNEFEPLDDDVESSENNSGVWEDNWSMKKYGNADQKISMLIPTPTFEIKTKIGDKNIDELSDSSNKDTNSENLDELYDEENEEYFGSENEMDEVPESTSLAKISRESNVIKSTSQLDIDCDDVNEDLFNNISGSLNKNYIDEVFEQILSTDGMNKNDDSHSTKEIKNSDQSLKSDDQISKNKNTASFEDNYPKYQSPLLKQYLVKPIQPIKVADAMKNASQSLNNKAREKSIETEQKADQKIVEKPLSLIIKEQDKTNLKESKEEDEVNTPPIKGSIAEREHLKWLKAIPIENEKNYPYSPENLHKRLSRSHEKYIDVYPEKVIEQDQPSEFDDIQLREDITKYKRDYYINNASLSNESINNLKEQINENSSIEADYLGDHPNDSSLTVSDDSLTRIYTLSSRETTILLPSSNASIQLSKDNDKVEANHEKNDKMEDNIPLPSVKKLAQFYASPTSITVDSNIKHHEHMDIPAGISKLVSKQYQLSDIPAKPIASITARTLPPKIKEDLKKSLHPHDDMTVIRHNERNVSPDIQRGLTRNSIAYFENL